MTVVSEGLGGRRQCVTVIQHWTSHQVALLFGAWKMACERTRLHLLHQEHTDCLYTTGDGTGSRGKQNHLGAKFWEHISNVHALSSTCNVQHKHRNKTHHTRLLALSAYWALNKYGHHQRHPEPPECPLIPQGLFKSWPIRGLSQQGCNLMWPVKSAYSFTTKINNWRTHRCFSLMSYRTSS